jgi:hypothetical protein
MIRTIATTLGLIVFVTSANAQAGEKKEDKRGGTIVGTVTEKGKGFIEVKAAGEEKGRKYVPHWRGGTPAQGGGFDKEILKKFDELKVGDRVRLEWTFEERPRVVTIERLQAGKKDEK